MASVNKVFLMGNLTREVDLRYTKQDKPVASMTVALNRRNGDHEEVCYVEVVAWGKTAENCQRYLSKGSSIYVDGYLRQDTWKDGQSGQNRSKLRVVAESIQFINTTRNGTTRATEPNPANSGGVPDEYDPRTPKASAPQQQEQPPVEDDIPF